MTQEPNSAKKALFVMTISSGTAIDHLREVSALWRSGALSEAPEVDWPLAAPGPEVRVDRTTHIPNRQPKMLLEEVSK